MKFRAAPQPPADARPPSFSRPGFVVHDPDDLTSPPPPPAPGASRARRRPPPASARGAPAAGAPPAPAVTALPFEVGKIKSGGQTTAPFSATAAPFGSTTAPFTTAPFPEAPPPKSKAGFYIGIAVAAAIILAGIFIVLDARRERANAYDLEQQEALAHHVAEQRLKEAELSAKEEADRAAKELQAAIDITKKQTAEQTRRELLNEIAAQRLAKLPGSIEIATTPAGAMVSIDGAAPIESPLKLDSVQPGKHRVTVTLAGHDPVELTADVKGSKTTDLGTVALQTLAWDDGALQHTRMASTSRSAPRRTPSGRPRAVRKDAGLLRGPSPRRLYRHLHAARMPRPHRQGRRW